MTTSAGGWMLGMAHSRIRGQLEMEGGQQQNSDGELLLEGEGDGTTGAAASEEGGGGGNQDGGESSAPSETSSQGDICPHFIDCGAVLPGCHYDMVMGANGCEECGPLVCASSAASSACNIECPVPPPERPGCHIVQEECKCSRLVCDHSSEATQQQSSQAAQTQSSAAAQQSSAAGAQSSSAAPATSSAGATSGGSGASEPPCVEHTGMTCGDIGICTSELLCYSMGGLPAGTTYLNTTYCIASAGSSSSRPSVMGTVCCKGVRPCTHSAESSASAKQSSRSSLSSRSSSRQSSIGASAPAASSRATAGSAGSGTSAGSNGSRNSGASASARTSGGSGGSTASAAAGSSAQNRAPSSASAASAARAASTAGGSAGQAGSAGATGSRIAGSAGGTATSTAASRPSAVSGASAGGAVSSVPPGVTQNPTFPPSPIGRSSTPDIRIDPVNGPGNAPSAVPFQPVISILPRAEPTPPADLRPSPADAGRAGTVTAATDSPDGWTAAGGAEGTPRPAYSAGTACVRDDECAAAWCANGRCAEPSCTDDRECPFGLCDDGLCRITACADDGGCAYGTCAEGRCAVRERCETGERCRSGSCTRDGRCACVTHADCPFGRCVDGQCADPRQSAVAARATYELRASPDSAEPQAPSAASLLPFERSVLPSAVRVDPLSPWGPLPAGPLMAWSGDGNRFVAGGGNTGGGCVRHADCETGLCRAGACVACTANAQCGPALACIAGRCITFPAHGPVGQTGPAAVAVVAAGAAGGWGSVRLRRRLRRDTRRT